MGVYAPIVTVLMALARRTLGRMLAEASAGATSKLLSFFMGATGFLAGWSWNQLLQLLLDATWKKSQDPAIVVLRSVVWASGITCGASMLLLLTAAASAADVAENDTHLKPAIAELASIASGVVVGSVWSNLISDIYDGWGGGLWRCWFLAGLISIVVPPVALSVSNTLSPASAVDEVPSTGSRVE